MVELEQLGYHLYEFEIAACRPVSDFEIVFKREDILSVTEYNPADIWPDYASVKEVRG